MLLLASSVFAVQLLALIVVSVFFGFTLTLMAKWPVLVAPRKYYGTYFAIFLTVNGLLQLLVLSLTPLIMAHFTLSKWQYLAPWYVFGGAVVLLLLALLSLSHSSELDNR